MRKLTAGTVGLALALGITACAPDQQESLPQPRVRSSVVELLPQETYAQFVTETKAGLAKADKELDAKKLPTRVTGPLLKYREAEYTLKKSLGDDFELNPIVLDEEAQPVVSGTSFPRTLMTVTGAAEGENLQTLSVWTQESPRTYYKLWADLELFPDQKLPGLVVGLNNFPGYLESDASDLVATPDQVLEEYASYLYTNKSADLEFTDKDPLKTETGDQLKSFKSALGDLGTVSMSAKPTENGVQAVSTEDGGVIAAGEIIYNFTITKSDEGGKLKLGGDVGAWLSEDDEGKSVEVKNKVTFNYRTTAAFYIPPSEAKDKTVKIIGSSTPVLSSATNK